jgi:transglutaminase/protease-like cytokinesis protein 3
MVGLLLRILFYAVFIGTPLVGLWIATSLAAHLGGATWMPWVVGLLLFPVLPGFWELYASSRRRPGGTPFFTTADRIGIRTFVIGLAFLVVLLCVYPQTAFVSLSTRGDWMLDGVKDPRAKVARGYLFAAASGLEWLYHATRTNPFKAQIDVTAQKQSDEAAKEAAQDVAKQQQQQQPQQQQGQEQDQPQVPLFVPQEISQEADKDSGSEQQQTTNDTKQEETKKKEAPVVQLEDEHKWPWKPTLHPAVANMPPSAEKSIESVAQYIAKQEHDPVQRIKALHDYVADRVAYDTVAFYSGNFPPQDAKTVFRTRKAVCAGSANLLAALGAAINENIVVVAGDARGGATSDKVTGTGHAWNAAKIKGHWYLIDSTWDAGFTEPKGFTKKYKTDYFLIPPEVMIRNHLPENQTWQLLAKPVSQGEFLRQPMLEPRFQAEGLSLISPQRAENETGANVVVVLKNPKHKWLMGTLSLNGQDIPNTTSYTNKDIVELTYKLPNKGKYQVSMFSSPQEYDSAYQYVGALDFVNR